MIDPSGFNSGAEVILVLCLVQCPLSDPHIHRGDVRKVWKECQEESFWYRGNLQILKYLLYHNDSAILLAASSGDMGIVFVLE